MTSRRVLSTLLGVFVLALMVSPASAASVQAFAAVEAGPANGCVFSPVFLPGAGIGGLVGTYDVPVGPTFTFENCFTVSSTNGHTNSGAQTNTAASGPVTASFNASATALSGPGAGQYQGTANANANIITQQVGASASGQVSGINFGGNGLGDSSGAYGVISQMITPMSVSHPTGPGFIEFQYTVNGQITVNSASFNPTATLQQLLGFANAILAVDLNNSVDTPFHTAVDLIGTQPPSVTPASGFTATLGPTGWTVNYSATVLSNPIPTNYGTPQNMIYGLEAQANPQTEDGSLGTAGSDFLTTAQLTGIQMFDATMHQVTDFLITTDAGIQLGPNGVIGTASQVPEPSTWLLLGSGFVGLVLWRKRTA